MRFGLRGKIIMITAATPLILGVAALVTVHRSVQAHVDGSSIHESLDHSVLVLQHMLAARGDALAGGAQVIARDPRFFSLLTLGDYQRDSRFTDTVRGMARDFNRITETELFEVLDRNGRTLASVGSVQSTSETRKAIVRRALGGKAALEVVAMRGSQYQVTATPVIADRHVVGVLLLGSEIGNQLARELRAQMRSEVSFIADDAITGTTLPPNADQTSLLASIAAMRADSTHDVSISGVFKVEGQGLTFITVVRRIPGSDPNRFQLFAMQRAFDPELIFLHQTQRDLGLLAILALVAALLTGILLSGQIRRPIQQLVRAAQELQKGNYDHPVRVKSRDEIGFLAERFNEMRQREQVYVNGLEETMRVKTDFINIASHELRTPISVIAGYRSLLESQSLGPLQPRQEQALQAIGSCLDKLTKVAEQATHMAVVHNQRLAPVILRQPLEPVIACAIGKAVAASHGRKVEVTKRFSPDLGPVDMDGELMEEAITNLVTNAIRFAPEGGHVEVAAILDGDAVEIRVTDDGPGIPEERIHSLFDHGYSVRSSMNHHTGEGADRSGGGMGLGLGITRGIVEVLGGTIRAGNLSEGGARFSIRLPRRARPELDRAA